MPPSLRGYVNYRQRIAGIVAACALCAGWATTAAAEEQTLKVVFSAISETLSLPFLVAQNQGWLNAEAVQVSGDANALRALLSGGADVAIVGAFNVFSAAAENAQIRAIGSWQGVQDYQMVVDTKINSFADMVGKTFASTGPGAPPEEFSKLVFEKHGIDPSKIQYIAIGGGGHATLLQAVLAGRAAGTLVTTSNALQGMKGGKVKILTGVAQEFPKLGYVYSVVRAGELKEPAKRAALQAYVLASIKASRYIAAHPADAAKFAVQKFPASDPEVLTKTIALLTQERVWGVNGGIEPDVTAETLRIARSTSLLKKDVPVSQVFDTQLVDAAIAQVGPQK
jgi:NitT/TauT family transport system substrate-binding protein